MIELFDTISSYINKITTFFGNLFDYVQTATDSFKTYLSWLPAQLIAAGLIIIVCLVIFRVLGR